MLHDHPAYQEELTKLKETHLEVENSLNTYLDLREFNRQKVMESLKELRIDPDETSQTYIDLLTGTSFFEHYDEKIKGLERSMDKPYFARIDFTPYDTSKLEKCYIGKTGLLREDDHEPVIIDWRAPIATLYYEGRLGESSYFVPDPINYDDKTITGEISLKRQFTIEHSELLEIFDIDITTTDPLLQKALGANAENRLKDIASTIQAEQNKIIRADIKLPLIVQGVAGSGKTTIALHRIAYLIYNYEKVFTPDSFMIVAPNNLFLDYISEVLPELGVEQVKQTTFIDFMLEFLEEKVKIVNPNDKLITFVNQETAPEHHMLKGIAKFKGSLTFKRIIDKYINDLEEDFIPRGDLALDDQVVIPASEIRSIFLNEYKYYPLFKRIVKLKARMKKDAKKIVSDLIEKEIARIDNMVDQYFLSGKESETERQKMLKLFEERDQRIKKWEKQSKNLVDNYFSNISKKKLFDFYKELITDPGLLELYTGGLVPDLLLLSIAEHSTPILNSGKIELEDLAPLVYLKSKIFGLEQRLRLSHVVVDEAQDFSLFQFYLLKKLSNTDSFTILGDLSQGIHSYRAIEDWDEVMKRIFTKVKTNYATLEQSYRTTIEIMNLANQVIKHFQNEKTILAKPIIRHGDIPSEIKGDKPKDLVQKIVTQIGELREEFHSIAIVGKTMDECKKIHSLFPKELKPKLITDDMTEYESTLVILPSYLTKGLEFDVVFIVSIEEEYSMDELDIKLLYIAMTRALHKLYLCSTGELSPILAEVSEEFLHR